MIQSLRLLYCIGKISFADAIKNLHKGIVDGLQLGMGGGSILDLGDCPHTVFVLLQLPAERSSGLV